MKRRNATVFEVLDYNYKYDERMLLACCWLNLKNAIVVAMHSSVRL